MIWLEVFLSLLRTLILEYALKCIGWFTNKEQIFKDWDPH